MIRISVEWMGRTARAYHRILKPNRTFVDLAGDERVRQPHLAEALQVRQRALV